VTHRFLSVPVSLWEDSREGYVPVMMVCVVCVLECSQLLGIQDRLA
jgi:hypothetical protein